MMEKNNLLLDIGIIITEKNNKPAIELRKHTTDINIIKSIVMAAFYEKGIIIRPLFRDKLKAISNLLEKGIIYKDDNGEFQFIY